MRSSRLKLLSCWLIIFSLGLSAPILASATSKASATASVNRAKQALRSFAKASHKTKLPAATAQALRRAVAYFRGARRAQFDGKHRLAVVEGHLCIETLRQHNSVKAKLPTSSAGKISKAEANAAKADMGARLRTVPGVGKIVGEAGSVSNGGAKCGGGEIQCGQGCCSNTQRCGDGKCH